MPTLRTWTCPKCGQKIGAGAAPNWTPMPAPGPLGGATFLVSCPGCSTALGVFSTPPE
jgi:hypothetical protein